MKTIICGHRKDVYWSAVCEALKQALARGLVITEGVSGGAKCVDQMGELWCRNKNIPYKVFEADWTGLQKAAGPARNADMAGYAEACVAILHSLEKKSGTQDMVYKANKAGLWTFVFEIPKWKITAEYNVPKFARV